MNVSTLTCQMARNFLLSILFLFSISTFSQTITLTSDADNLTVVEDGAVIITATSDAVSENDIMVPLTLSGTALLSSDYTFEFSSKGDETFLLNFDDNIDFGNMKVHQDGRIFFLNESTLRVYDKTTSTLTAYTLSSENNYTSNFRLVNNIIYARNNSNDNNNEVNKIDISDLDNIVETLYIQLAANMSFQDGLSSEGNTLLYIIYNSVTDLHETYTKEEGSDPVKRNTDNHCCGTVLLKNGRIFKLDNSYLYELINGVHQYRQFNGFIIDSEKISVYNDELYVRSLVNGESSYSINKLDLSSTSGNISQTSLTALPITEDSVINKFATNPSNGNIITQNIDSDNAVSVSSYQFSPQFKIIAGDTSSIFTINTTQDTTYEIDETIVLSPGSPTSGSLSDDSPISFTLQDNDTPSVVTFAFSSSIIEENSTSTVTLTATTTPLSGAAISIPFTLSGTATQTSEYTVSATEIIIPSGSSSASVTISTEGLNDDDIEIIETIIFTIGSVTNATTEETEVTLNLVSDDDPIVTSITNSDSSLFDEATPFVLTATTDAASSKDVNIPVSLSGTALNGTDYTFNFASLGQETVVTDIASNYGSMRIHDDGRLIFIKDSNLRVYDPSTNVWTEKDLSNYYGSGKIEINNNILYVGYNNITKIDISDLENITETVYIDFVDGHQLDGGFSLEGDNIVYNIYDSNLNDNNRKVYKKTLDADPELIYAGDECCNQVLLLNDKVYQFRSDNVRELVGGVFTDYKYFGTTVNTDDLLNYNGSIYARSSNSTQPFDVAKFILPSDMSSEAAVVSYESLPVSEDSESTAFDFHPNTGDLYLVNYSNSNSFSVSSYQITPQLKISAGQTSGTFTITPIEDGFYEVDETVIFTPGTPTNGTLGSDVVAYTATLQNFDTPSVVTFALSSSTIEELNGSVTLTATTTPVSGADITIPFTASDTSTALPSEYTVSGTEIIIPAGSSSASVTITTSADQDDTDIEVIETIIFTIGSVTNATTEASEVILNLVSDDDPIVTSITNSNPLFDEATPFVLTATIDAASSKNVNIPVSLSGTALNGADYTFNFSSLGQETVVTDFPSYYGKMRIHSDGRLIFINNNNLRVYDPTTNVWTDKSLSNYYYESFGMQLINNVLYVATYEEIYKVDISDLDNITETLYVDFASGHQLETGFSVEGDNIIYNIYDSNLNDNNRKVYKKIGDADPELLWSGAECCYYPVLLDDKVYQVSSNFIRQIIDGVYSDYVYLGININKLQTTKHNGSIYVQPSGTSYSFDVAKLILPQSLAPDPENPPTVTYESLPTSEDSEISSFDLDINTGNLFLVNSSNSNYSVSSYQLSQQIQILAGETQGIFTINPVDDSIYEIDETVIFTLGTPTNSTLASGVSDYTATLQDNDTPPVVTFAFSSASIEENSSDTVTLTATSSPVSGVAITIPFTISDSSTALVSEYEVSATEITIASGTSSGFVTISTEGLDDNNVELNETIIFTIGALVNATTEATDVTLNLVSDDNPNATLVATNPVMAEGASTTITLELESASGKDVTVPLILSGTATFNVDYSTDFDTEGEEQFMMSINDSYNSFATLEDGRYIFLDNSELIISDYTNDSSETWNLDYYFQYITISNNVVYLKTTNKIHKILVSELVDNDINNNIVTTPILTSDDLGNNEYFAGDNITAEGDSFLYQINANNGFKIYKKEGSNTAELLYNGDEYAQRLLLFNNRVYRFNSSTVTELYNQEYTNTIEYNNIDFFQLKIYNNQVYSIVSNNNVREVIKLSLETDIINSSSNGTVTSIPYQLSGSHDYLYDFSFDSLGNLLLYNRLLENSSSSYGIYKYQLFPEIFIPAGSTNGTFTFASIDDISYEETETITVVPGAIENATVTTADLELSITDDDNPPVITFELSSETINENSEISVTLTATSDIPSGREITIPFTLEGTALSDEYEVDATQIVIPGNATSASITISTFGYNDDEVEPVETIIFNFDLENIINATSVTENITLNLLSEDLAVVSSLTVDEPSINEGASSVLSVTLDSPTSSDVYVPVTLSGTATATIDYQTVFAASGEETLIREFEENFNDFHLLDDGRFALIRNNPCKIYIYDPIANAFDSASLNYCYDTLQVEGNIIYAGQSYNGIYTLDISNISSGVVVENKIIDINDTSYLRGFSVEGGNVIYNTEDNSNSVEQTYLLNQGQTTPELIYSGTDCCYKPILLNNRVYFIDSWRFKELVNGELTEAVSFTDSSGGVNININNNKLRIFNGSIYSLKDTDSKVIVKLNLEDGILSSITNYTLSENISFISSFDFSADGALLMLNGSIVDPLYGIYSYLQSLQIKILAGEVNASATVNTIDDDSYETTETVIATLGTPINATLAEGISAVNIDILDDDIEPVVTFALSKEVIIENDTEDVELTATLSNVSGYVTTISFSEMTGSAIITEEYIVTDTDNNDDVLSMSIPAGELSTSISISTQGLDDTDVEVLETINFNVSEIENGSNEANDIVLLLESDDDPSLVDVSASKIEFAEHESSVITATIDLPSSRDVLVSFTSSGDATQGLDYTLDFESRGEESIIRSFTDYSRDFDILEDGRYVVLGSDSNYLLIYELDGTITEVNLESSNNYSADRIYASSSYVFLVRSNRISKLNLDTMELSYETEEPDNGNYSNSISYINDKLFYYLRTNDGSTIVYSKIIGENPEIVVSIPNGYPGDGIDGLVVDQEERVFLWRSDGIYTIDENNDLIDFINSNNSLSNNQSLSDLRLNQNKLYGKIYNYNTNQDAIIVFQNTACNYDPSQGTGLSCWSELDYILGPQVQSIIDFSFDNNGQLILNNGMLPGDGYQFSSYRSIAEIKIAAGNIEGSLIINGLEDDLNAPGEEEDESLILNFSTPINVIVPESSTLLDDMNLTILNNQISLTEDSDALVNVPALSNSAVAWGDYDRDGDQDMAIMGLSLTEGVITRLYENQEGVFVNSNPGLFDPRYEGDIMWVDYNKDGYIDLIISGLNLNDEPTTTIYENQAGQGFTPSNDLTLPNLYNTSMDSGDLDNDGDVDFIINGTDSAEEWKKFIYTREGSSLLLQEDYNGQFGDDGEVNGVMKIADNNFDGDLDIFMIGNSNSRIQNNTFISNDSSGGNYSLGSLNNPSLALFGEYIYFMGQENDDSYKLYRRSLLQDYQNEIYEMGNESSDGLDIIPGLSGGSIAIADYNNDGFEDMVITGENSDATYVSQLYDGVEGSAFKLNTEIELLGLGNSTAKWVDYDLDGDLDLFITGTSENGEATKLYRTDLLNKSNTASSAISNLVFESLGNGKVKLSWDAPEDDFSTSLGYVIRLATSEGGSELSNTESNLETGQRLITKSPVVYSNVFETLLDPGVYYWSVQSVDDGLKGSVFSEEQSFVLTYEWKLLNQGGIIDRSISAFGDPIVKLVDMDSDNDMDLVYGSREESDIQVFTLGSKNFEYLGSLDNSRNISDIQFLDFNDDSVMDILINSWDSNSNNSFKLFNSQSDGPPQEVFQGTGLYEAKIKLIDINNDGEKEIVHIGRNTSNSTSQIKMFVYEQEGNSMGQTPIDISDQISGLKQGAYNFGNFDNDDDIDFAVIGRSNSGLKSRAYINETVFTETIAPIYTLEEAIEFVGAIDSTLDFIDFDADGDLDMAITGTGIAGDMFVILSNNGESGTDLGFVEVPNTGLTPIRNAKVDFGDYNSDGYPDILYSGRIAGQGDVTKLVEFDPETQSYVESDFDLTDIVNASIAFGDVDGDNDLDFAIAGESTSNNNNLIKTYLNVRNESAEVQQIAQRLGIITTNATSRNEDDTVYVINEKPSTPQNLEVDILGFDSETGTYQVKLTWDESTDDFTPQKGLTYGIKVGTTEGGDDIMKMNSLTNGYRLFAGKGNVEHKSEWILNLEDDDYYWSVQAIDAAYSGSSLSETKTFNTTATASTDNYNKLDVLIYPNPVNDNFVNIVSPLSETKQILLYDLQGRTIISKKLEGTILNISNISSGVYLLKVTIDGKQKVTKLIVN